MNANLLTGLRLTAAVVLMFPSALVQTSASPQQPVPIPMDQLGAVAGKQYQGGGLSVSADPEGGRVCCVFQRLEGKATANGLWLSSTAEGSSGERFRVMAVNVGRGNAQLATEVWPGNDLFVGTQPALSCTGIVNVANNVAHFIRDGLTEKYSACMDGVRQDFVVEQRPGGEGELRVELVVTGATAESLGNGAQITLNYSGRKLAYTRLHVTDAHGQELTARMQAADETHLAVVVDDAAAVYPVLIDPTFSDANWVSIGGIPGADGTVSAVVFDGSGNLFIGGSCNVVGNVVAKQIAKWDGNNWSSLGGINGTVSALAISGTDLYVGGAFNIVGVDIAGGIIASNIARWNGTSWSSLGTGVFGPVTALAVSGSDLYVAGTFSLAGDVFALRVAKWDGSTWSGLGSGLNNTVSALAVIGSDLYAGGSFTLSGSTSVLRIAKWNGSSWSAVGSGMGGAVNALAVSGSDLYAGGTFTIPANNIAKWNGSVWSALGTGVGSTVNSMAVSGTDLYVGGAFTTPATRIAKWDGSSWSALGTGMSGAVTALAVSGTTVAAGGSFTTPAMRIATWNGTTWANLGSGLNNPVSAVAVAGSDVYFGGGFTFRGVLGAANIVRWNGAAWSALAGGLNGSVSALVTSGGNLYAGGAFTAATNAGGTPVTANRIAKWNGSTWSALDVGLNNTVSALTFSGSDLYAGGSFSIAGSNPAFNVARWNGVSWSAVGGGVNNTINALATMGSDVVAAGSFTAATNSGSIYVNAARIARWDGSAWSALGSGMDNPVNALVVSGSTLYAGGFFGNAGGVPVGRIAQWNSTVWSALGSATNNIFVNALAVSGSDLYVGGSFSAVGPVPAANLAKWDGNNWTGLGAGISGTSIPSVNALVAAGGSLYVGGSFTKTGDKAAGYVGKASIGVIAAPGRFTNPVYSPVTGFSCTFLDATVGQPYRIQSTPSLTAGSWTDLTNFTFAAPFLITVPASGPVTNTFLRAVTP